MNLLRLSSELNSPQLCVDFCLSNKLIIKERLCPKCAENMRLVKGACADLFQWECSKRRCNTTMSIRKGSCLENSKLPIKSVILMVYLYAKNLTRKEISQECEIDQKNVTKWLKKLRDIIDEKTHDTVLGGVGQTVEIDETCVARKKYNKGRRVKSVWVFGVIARETKKSVLFVVPDRGAATLVPLIKRHVLPGTTIVSDG
jgi:transposase-like protein